MTFVLLRLIVEKVKRQRKIIEGMLRSHGVVDEKLVASITKNGI